MHDFIKDICLELALACDSHASSDGTIQIEKNMDRKPPQRLFAHTFFSPLTASEIDELQKISRRQFPPSLRDLYSMCNGGEIFYGALSWRGLRFGPNRDVANHKPISLEYGNIIERPMRNNIMYDNSAEIRFGVYAEAAIELMIKVNGDETVHAVPRYRDGPFLYKWNGLREFFVSEVNRMTKIKKTQIRNNKSAIPFMPEWAQKQA